MKFRTWVELALSGFGSLRRDRRRKDKSVGRRRQSTSGQSSGAVLVGEPEFSYVDVRGRGLEKQKACALRKGLPRLTKDDVANENFCWPSQSHQTHEPRQSVNRAPPVVKSPLTNPLTVSCYDNFTLHSQRGPPSLKCTCYTNSNNTRDKHGGLLQVDTGSMVGVRSFKSSPASRSSTSSSGFDETTSSSGEGRGSRGGTLRRRNTIRTNPWLGSTTPRAAQDDTAGHIGCRTSDSDLYSWDASPSTPPSVTLDRPTTTTTTTTKSPFPGPHDWYMDDCSSCSDDESWSSTSVRSSSTSSASPPSTPVSDTESESLCLSDVSSLYDHISPSVSPVGRPPARFSPPPPPPLESPLNTPHPYTNKASLAQKVDMLMARTKHVQLKISEARQEEEARQEARRLWQEGSTLRKQRLMNTLQTLKERLECQEDRMAFSSAYENHGYCDTIDEKFMERSFCVFTQRV